MLLVRVLESELKGKVNKNLEILKLFFDITNAVRSLNKQFKNVSFFIIFYGLEGIFTVFLRLSLDKFQNYDYAYAIPTYY